MSEGKDGCRRSEVGGKGQRSDVGGRRTGAVASGAGAGGNEPDVQGASDSFNRGYGRCGGRGGKGYGEGGPQISEAER